jgi:hypothetical protein
MSWTASLAEGYTFEDKFLFSKDKQSKGDRDRERERRWRRTIVEEIAKIASLQRRKEKNDEERLQRSYR